MPKNAKGMNKEREAREGAKAEMKGHAVEVIWRIWKMGLMSFMSW